jgi:hypothetical protein
MVDVSSNPHAWLSPFWAALKHQPFFDRLALELQAEQLAAALEADYPTEAHEIRDWNATTRRAMLAVLEEGVRAGKASKEVELWRMQKGARQVTCVAVYVATGVDLRLLPAGEMLRTELFRDAPHLQARARQWRELLVKSGWRELVTQGPQ